MAKKKASTAEKTTAAKKTAAPKKNAADKEETTKKAAASKKTTAKTKASKEEMGEEIVKKEVPEELKDDGTDIESTILDADRWWLQDPWRSLLDPNLVENVDLTSFELSSLIEQFVDKMMDEEFIDFRISGMAIYSSAKFYHQKISGVISEEEEIEKERKIARLRREVPSSISQPLRKTQKIATSEELFGAMRRAILETMQRRTKLRVRREKRSGTKERVKIAKIAAKLPAEILKHITGGNETAEEKMNRWHQKVITISNLNDGIVTMDDIKKYVYSTDEPIKIRKMKYIDAFMNIMHLGSLNKLRLYQYDETDPIEIKVTDKTKVKFG